MMKPLLNVPGYHSCIGIAGEGYFYADVWVSGEQEHGSATYVRAWAATDGELPEGLLD